MATFTVLNEPDDPNCAFRVRVGDALAAIGRTIGLGNNDVAVLEKVRDKTPANPVSVD